MWLMRQAGRALPEYRALKQRHSFLELVRTPDLAAEVTLQPLRRFGFDAAILFSDILVIAEALGQPYHFRDTGGIAMAFPLRTPADLDRLTPNALVERLQYTANALRLIRQTLGERTALLGFSGSPWTLANFMVEGGSAARFSGALDWLATAPATFERLLEVLTQAVIDYLHLQIDQGVDAVQVFDTLGGLLPPDRFQAASGRWLERVVHSVAGRVPVIVFAKGVYQWEALVQTGARVVGVDWTVPLAEVRARLPASVAVQGNLDPDLLRTTPAQVQQATRTLLTAMRGARGHIFNLGHGVPADAKLENLACLADTVRGFS